MPCTNDMEPYEHLGSIRFNGIDFPEKEQAYVKKAKQAASELIFVRESRFTRTVLTNMGGR